MRAHDRDADARRADADVVGVPNFLGFFHHFHFLFVVAVVHHRRVVGKQVERVSPREDFFRFYFPVVDEFPRLLFQLGHGLRAGARRRLVRRHDHSLDANFSLNRGRRHQRDNRRAVRVGNDPTFTGTDFHTGHSFWVHLWNDQRHAFRHAKRARVIDDVAPFLHRDRAKLFRNGPSGRKQRDIHVIERRFRQLFRRVRLPVEFDFLPRASRGRQHLHLAVREVSLFQNSQKLLPDRSSHAGDAHSRPFRGFLRERLHDISSRSTFNAAVLFRLLQR